MECQTAKYLMPPPPFDGRSMNHDAGSTRFELINE